MRNDAEKAPSYSLSVNVPLVTVDAVVLAKDGHFIPGLKKENFRVSEDGVPQQITAFNQAQAPITVVMLIEFASNNYSTAFLSDALHAAYAFTDGLKKDDWVGLIEYDLKPNILLDFTQDKTAVLRALSRLRVPGFSERNLFDALYDTLDRMDHVKGRKVVLVIGTGIDSFSKKSYDQVLKKIRQTEDVRIFTISTGRAFNEWFDANYGRTTGGQIRSLNYLQADSQMETFAKLTGGRWYNPRFQTEFADIFRDISDSAAPTVHAQLHAFQPEAGWQLPQAEGGAGGPTDRPAAGDSRPQEQRVEIQHRQPPGLHCEAAGRIKKKGIGDRD